MLVPATVLLGFLGAHSLHLEPATIAMFGAALLMLLHTLGDDGSLVGASANLIVAGYAERAGQRIDFLRFLLIGFPLMLLTVGIANVYVLLRYF
jgi:Na+/H+ antiporter NhaD/arsenite permease-like protein